MMPRQNKKAKKILYDILGMPPAMRDKRTAKQKRVDRMLLSDEGIRAR